MRRDDETFERALAALQAGNLEDAERRFKAVLRTQPRHGAALNLIGIALTQLRKYPEAETYLRRALQETPKSDATLYNYGIILKALARPAEALQRFTEALALNPAAAETWNNRGTVFSDLQRHDEAIVDFDRAITLQPRYAEAYCNKGKVLAKLQRFDEALAFFDTAATLKPDLFEAWLGRGTILTQLKRYEGALAAYGRALALKPNSAECWLGRGNAFHGLKCNEDALASYVKASQFKSDMADAWLGRGNALHDLRQHDEALAAYDRALSLDPSSATAHSNRASALLALKRHAEVLESCDRAISIRPDLAIAHCNRGAALLSSKRYVEALASFDRAISLDSTLPLSYSNRASALLGLGQYTEALANCDHAIALDPTHAPAYSNRGLALLALRRHAEALASCDKAVRLDPNSALAHSNQGTALSYYGEYLEAFTAFDTAFTIEPDLQFVEAMRFHMKQMLCRWDNFNEDAEHLLAGLRNRKLLITPFSFLITPSLPADQLQCAKAFAELQPAATRLWQDQIYSHDRVRIAYLSADFRNHAVGHLIAGLFEQHDKSRFEITAISFGPDDNSAVRHRIKSGAEHFRDVRDNSDAEIAGLIHRHEIDIAIDLMGWTQDCRPTVLARRPAPIQVNYLGYPATMGADWMNYIMADATTVPKDHWSYYTEKVVWLPDAYQVNDSKRSIADETPSRGACGLPEDAFVFCCFNNTFKMTPAMFDIWMRLLLAVEGSVLWLFEGDSSAAAARCRQNLQREAEERGVSPERVIFAGRTTLADHLARHRQADLFLDTLPYNAHTTASDALWAGLPVLTCLGPTFAGRVAASLLKAAELPELITTSLQDYEALALKLARDPALLATIKAKLARNRGHCALFDTTRFTRHIEAAYRQMWQAYQDRIAPASFAVRQDRVTGECHSHER